VTRRKVGRLDRITCYLEKINGAVKLLPHTDAKRKRIAEIIAAGGIPQSTRNSKQRIRRCLRISGTKAQHIEITESCAGRR
jgi:hypothetical protein